MGLFCFRFVVWWQQLSLMLDRSPRRSVAQNNSDLVHMNTCDNYCRRNCCLLVTRASSFPAKLLCFSSHKGLWTPWSALSVLDVATEMLFDVPCTLQSQVLRCLSALPSRPPCYTLNKLFSFCFSSLFLCWQFLITALLRRNAHHLPRFALESVLVNCRASAALLSRWRLHQDLIYESSVYKLPV